MSFQVRWLIRRDMPDVLRIESASFEFPWTDDDFLNVLRQRNCIGMVVEHDYKVVVFMIYELQKQRLDILNFAVDPQFRRRRAGFEMVERLREKLSQQRRRELLVEVREQNLKAQLFFRSQGFKAIRVLRDHYEDTSEDCYLMQYLLPMEQEFSDNEQRAVHQ